MIGVFYLKGARRALRPPPPPHFPYCFLPVSIPFVKFRPASLFFFVCKVYYATLLTLLRVFLSPATNLRISLVPCFLPCLTPLLTPILLALMPYKHPPPIYHLVAMGMCTYIFASVRQRQLRLKKILVC